MLLWLITTGLTDLTCLFRLKAHPPKKRVAERALCGILQAMAIADRFGRFLRDLRISVTDRCNFRCTYCMPKEVFGRGYAFLRRDELLSFEEITRVVRIFVALGTQKIRLTGGEPLLRRDLDVLVRMIRDAGA